MSEPFLGQVIMAGFNFAPKSYAMCNGQLLPIAQNTALFSLLGTTFGGDGRVTFGLPDLRGRTPLHQGQGPGLSNYVMGQSAGQETHTLIVNEMPMHNHVAQANSSANQVFPQGMIWGGESTGTLAIYSNSTADSQFAPTAIGSAGGNQPHNNMQPYEVINFCIALAGIFPSRN
jgi:microcystin-dependent protein